MKNINKISTKAIKIDKKINCEFLVYENKLNKLKNFVFKKGNFNPKKSIRIRVISSNMLTLKLL